MEHGEKAAELFVCGYNCAQSVAVAFCDLTGLNEDQASKMVSPFGGGFGRQREVCGAISGLCLVLGLLHGYSDPTDDAAKTALYRDTQALCADFRAQFGSLLCRDLLSAAKTAPAFGTEQPTDTVSAPALSTASPAAPGPDTSPVPTPRDARFYHERPCVAFVRTAAELLEAYLRRHPPKTLPENPGT